MTKKITAFVSEEYEVLGGKALVLRTKQSGQVYQLRMWISTEKKYLRESLRTRDLDTALQRAEKRVFEVFSDVQSGRKLFGITIQELVEEYLKWRQEDIETGNITAGRFVTIKSQLKHFLEYKGEKTKVSELDIESCYDYANWRRKTHKTTRLVTIRNEQATINHMMKYAYRKGLSHFISFEFRKLRINTDEVAGGRRNTFTLEQYDDLVKFMRSWSSKKESGDDEKLRNKRLMIRDCVLIASNTMLRIGELWQLRWKDIHGYQVAKDSEGQQHELVTINVRGETSKRRVSRTIVTRGGDYFKRLKTRSEYTDDDDFVFCGDTGRQRFAKKRFYDAWSELMEGIGIDYKSENITWYSLRHFGITCRLRTGASIYDVAKIAGTSTAFIDSNYGHFDTEMSKSVALRNFKISKDGISAE